MTQDTFALFPILMGLFGGLALFLMGMEQMTDALKAVAGDGMKTLLARLTRNRVAAALTGAFVTAIIQSSSVTTVLVVGFVSAGLMTLAQSVGIIMGANAGTTITAQIVAFKVTQYALALIALGFVVQFVGKRDVLRRWGGMLVGLGLIFFGMGLMSDAMDPLRTYQPFIDIMKSMTNPLLGILAGAVFTGLVQSSSATSGIVIVLASQGFITLPAGIALSFGANIGTCVTALLSTLGKPRVAMRAAAVHVIFNVVGVLLWIGFIRQLAELTTSLSPAYPDLQGTARLAAEAPRQIANANTAFNLLNTVVLLPFSVLLARAVERLLPDKPQVVPERSRQKYLDEAFLLTPALAFDAVRRELCRFGQYVRDLAEETVDAIRTRSLAPLDRMVAEHLELEPLHDQIIGFLSGLSQLDESETGSRQVQALTAIATHMEHVNQIFATDVTALARRRLQLNVPEDPVSTAAIQRFYEVTRSAFRSSVQALEEDDLEAARSVIQSKGEVKALARSTRDTLARQVTSADLGSLAQFRLQSQVVELLDRLFHFARSIAKDLVAMGEIGASEEKGVGAADPDAVRPA